MIYQLIYYDSPQSKATLEECHMSWKEWTVVILRPQKYMSCLLDNRIEIQHLIMTMKTNALQIIHYDITNSNFSGKSWLVVYCVCESGKHNLYVYLLKNFMMH